MPQLVDPDSFGFLANDVARLIRAEMDRRIGMTDIGMTSGEARTLVHAARAGAVRQNVLAERMGVEAMTVTGYLDRLEVQGLVERIADPTDRRAKLVRLTPAADMQVARIRSIAAGVRAEAAQGIDPAEWERFLAILKQVRANLCALKAEAREAALA